MVKNNLIKVKLEGKTDSYGNNMIQQIIGTNKNVKLGQSITLDL